MKELSLRERKEVAELFENWLGMYTEEVITKVMKRFDEIIENEFAMKLLKELKERQDKEKQERFNSFMYMFDFLMVEGEEKNLQMEIDTIHNHTLTHAKSYRDVLYDMYIR